MSSAAYLDDLSADEALATLRRCCASSVWADAMNATRPFADDAEMLEAADRIWASLGRSDWLEAFAAHPRIGDRVAAGSWSAREQSGMTLAPEVLKAAMLKMNDDYERKFGHVFLICATGLDAQQLIRAFGARLPNTPEEELHIAAAEQAKIMKIRLAKLGDE